MERPKRYSLAIELTAHCNQKCGYCYNDWREDDGAGLDGRDGDRMLARAEKVLDAIELEHVTITGGEPLSSAAVWQLLDRLDDRGIAAQIISNGGLVTDRIAGRLAEHPILFVQVTLNGPDAAMHEAHVGKGHYAPTLRGIEALGRHGVPVVGCVVVTRKNAAHVGATLALWRSLSVRHVALSRFSPAGYAVKQAAELLPSRGEMIEALDQAAAFGREHPDTQLSCTMPIPPCVLEPADYAPVEFGHCPIGTEMQEVALGPDGRLRNCTLHAHAIGGVSDVLDDDVDVAALLTHDDVTGYRKRLPRFCEGCLYADTCGGGCGAAAIAMMGEHDRRLPDPFLWQHVDDDLGSRLARERSKRHLEVVG